MAKVALLELAGSHDECLYSQVLFLKEAGYQVTLICSENLRGQVNAFPHVDTFEFLSLRDKGAIGQWKLLLRLRSFLIREGFQKVIFNTASGKIIRNLLLLPFPSRIEFIGTAHSLPKLQNSTTQRLISRKIRKYFFLNDYLSEQFKNSESKLRVSTYYPIFFPEVKGVELDKPKEDIWVCIPGQLEIKRRDYPGLLNALEKVKRKVNIKFILLGRSNHRYSNAPEVIEMMKRKGLENQFVLFDSFIENSLFHSYLLKSDYILPLIHPGSTGGSSYLRNQVSGAFNLAFAYRKPLLMEQTFSAYEDFKDSSLFYNEKKLNTFLENLPHPEKLRKQFYQLPKWNFAHQQEQYIRFIES